MGIGTGVNSSSSSQSGYEAYQIAETARLQSENARRAGQAAGYNQGYDAGFNDGQQTGYDKGWGDGIERGNKELWKADGYIKAHIADKERLQQTVNEQAQQIAQLLAHIATLEGNIDRKDEAMRVIQNSSLPEMARGLKAENEQLREQVQILQADSTENTRKVNRAAVMVNSMRNTLTILTADRESERTREVEYIFCEQYKKEMARGLEMGVLSEALEDDQTFASTMPSTHRFLTAILQSVNERIELDRVGQHQTTDDSDWVPDGS
ncbi:MAG: hypothetical protein WC617_12335 [Rhodanobacter sp.]|jgi:flagellar biosynthesis/type III secretory pathway protein FliH